MVNYPHVGLTYWYDPDCGKMFLAVDQDDRVTEKDGWAFLRLTSALSSDQFALNSTFYAGLDTYDLARRVLLLAGVAELVEPLQACKLQSGLVLFLAPNGADIAFMLFPIGRGLAPNVEGPKLFAAWKSKLTDMELLSWMAANQPRIWPL
jgi:hypothetical protein